MILFESYQKNVYTGTSQGICYEAHKSLLVYATREMWIIDIRFTLRHSVNLALR